MSTMYFTFICGTILISFILYILSLKRTLKIRDYGEVLLRYNFYSKYLIIIFLSIIGLLIVVNTLGLINQFQLEKLIIYLPLTVGLIGGGYSLTRYSTFSTVGLGKTYKYNQFLFEYTLWKDVKAWRWSIVDKELLMLSILIAGKIVKTEIQIPKEHVIAVDTILKKCVSIDH